MTILIVRMHKYDDATEKAPHSFSEARKYTGDDWPHYLASYSKDYLGFQIKIANGAKTCISVKQTAFFIEPDGMLTFLGRKDDSLPPPRKVKIINNPTKQTNWLSVLEHQQDEPLNF